MCIRDRGWVAHSQVRNRGTFGGAVAHSDSAAEFPAALVARDQLPVSVAELSESRRGIGAACEIERRRIELGRIDGNRIEVRAGVVAGERVVSRGGAFLADGDQVRVSNGD